MGLKEMREFLIDNSSKLCRSPEFASALKSYDLLETAFFYEYGELELSNIVRLHCVLSDIFKKEDDVIKMYEVMKLMKEMNPTAYETLTMTPEMKSAIDQCTITAKKEKAWVHFFRGVVLNALVHEVYLDSDFEHYVIQEGVLTTNQLYYVYSKRPVRFNSDWYTSYIVDCALDNNTVVNVLKCFRECSYHTFQFLIASLPSVIKDDVPEELTKPKFTALQSYIDNIVLI